MEYYSAIKEWTSNTFNSINFKIVILFWVKVAIRKNMYFIIPLTIL